MASSFHDFLEEWDIFGTVGCTPKHRGILLADHFDSSEVGVVARQLVPSGISSFLSKRDFMQCDDEKPLGAVFFGLGYALDETKFSGEGLFGQCGGCTFFQFNFSFDS